MLASAMVLMNYSKSLVQGFTFITTVVTAANLPLYLCCALALLVLWRRGAAAGHAATCWCWRCRDWPTWCSPSSAWAASRSCWAMVLAAAGLPVYALLRMRGGASPLASRTARASR